MQKKIKTIEDVGGLLQTHVIESEKLHREVRLGFADLRREISLIHSDLIEHDKRTELMLREIADVQKLTVHVERIRQHLRERDHVEL
ncbi:MAG: hypothetical protein AAB482_00760 [Patescibacteria group bacterium]